MTQKRDAKPDSNVVDGAVFAYVWSNGTDPEILLLLECRREKDGMLTWKYGPARFTHRGLRVEHGGQEVWKVGEGHGSAATPYRLADVGSRSYAQIETRVREFTKSKGTDSAVREPE